MYNGYNLLLWNLHDKININRENTLWANSHASSFDGKVWLYDYVSELYDSYRHILPSCAVPAPLPQGDKQK